jgi:hypothetical protein
MDQDAVGALRDFDEKMVGLALAGVVLEQAGAETAGFDAHGVVDGWVVGGVAVEDVDGDAVLLERLVMVRDGVVKDVPEEELTATRATKGARADDAVELSLYRAVLGQRSECEAAPSVP